MVSFNPTSTHDDWGDKRVDRYQSAVSHKFGKLFVLAFIDLCLQDTKRHGFLDDLIIIGDIALVDTAMEQSRWVVSTAHKVRLAWTKQSRIGLGTRDTRDKGLLFFPNLIDRQDNIHHRPPLFIGDDTRRRRAITPSIVILDRFHRLLSSRLGLRRLGSLLHAGRYDASPKVGRQRRAFLTILDGF